MESHKDVAFIERLFYEQIRNLSVRRAQSLDVQHNDRRL